MKRTSSFPFFRSRLMQTILAFVVSWAMARLVGAGVAAVSKGNFDLGWMSATLILTVVFFVLILAWAWGGRQRMVALWMALAFVLRLGVGIGLSQALPVWGYTDPQKNQSQMAGYLFRDASERDTRAWELSQSKHSLLTSFSDEVKSDQYGGLLGLSAVVYRYLSPDAHRQYLILILGAFFTALGVPFLYQAAQMRWSARAAVIAVWVYLLYPDAIFFGASQMREPFLVGLSAVALWAIFALDRKRIFPWVALVLSLASMTLLSSRVAVVIAGALAVLFLLDRVVSLPDRRWRIFGWAALAVGAVVILAFSWEWFRSSAGWDTLVTMRNSGRINLAITDIGEQYAFPVIITYGLAQPVLPAAITEPAIALWKTIGIVRSAGWYLLAPFLLYALFRCWKEADAPRRRLMIGIVLSLTVWLVIASARGGGDQTDNPRYRSLLLVWLALSAGWALDWALAHRDVWLWRWLLVEAIFLGFFTSWYASRYFHFGGKLPFWVMVVLIVLGGVAVLGGGWLWDRWKRSKATVL